MIAPPQPNMNVAAQQNADVMQAMQGGADPMGDPQVQQAKAGVMQMMEQFGITPEQLQQLGKLAEMTIQNPEAYPMFIGKLQEFGMNDAQSLRGEIDYQALAVFATVAKLI